MSTDEDYVAINVDIMNLTSRAVHVRCADNIRRWIPRSLIYGPHESKLTSKIGELSQIKVFRWFATKSAIPIAKRQATP